MYAISVHIAIDQLRISLVNLGCLQLRMVLYRETARRSLAVTFIRAKLGREGMVGPSVVLI